MTWQTKRLGDISEIVSGGTPKTNVSRYWNGNILWITPKDMGKLDGVFVEVTGRMITEAGLKDSSAKVIPPNSIILSTRAPIGHLAINRKAITTNQGCKGIIPANNFDTKFLYYFFEDSVDLLNSLGNGTTFKELSGSKLKEVEIPFPSITEQRRIVKTLDEVFEKVKKAKKNAEKNLQNSKELFESYLQSVFTNPRNDWEKKRLGDVCNTGAGGTPLKSHRDYYEIGTIPWLRSGEVNKKDIMQSELFITKKGVENSSARLFPMDTVLVAMYGATAGQVGILRFESTTNQAVCGILPDKNFIPEFIYYVFRSKKKELVNQAVGGAQPNISQVKIKNTVIPLVPLAEQKTIVKKLNTLSLETKKLEKIYEQKLADLEELKKSVLSKAFHAEL